MKKILLLVAFICVTNLTAQQPYYNDVNLTLTGQDLYDELQNKLSDFNESYIYGDVPGSFLVSDINPNNNNEVLLVYGFNDSDGDCTTDRTRNINEFGGDVCEYNREHVFPRSRAMPPMGDANNSSSGIVADPHNLRPSDVQRNGTRGSKLFGDGSGNSGDVSSGNWYPGDEWKGDVARIAMYMYVRYGDRCLPEFTGTGPMQGDTEMLQLFLNWNVEDPVSEVEEQRNPHFETAYGNRNPFIDNPVLATIIWGGPQAEDIWGLLSIDDVETTTFSMYPNPTDTFVHIETSQPINIIQVYDLTGKLLMTSKNREVRNTMTTIDTSSLSDGVYLVSINNTVKKLIVQ